MVYRSWNVPQLTSSADNGLQPSLWGSVRLTYTICAFLSNVIQIAMRNMLGLVILRMVRPRPEDAALQQASQATQYQLQNLTSATECGDKRDSYIDSNNALQSGDLSWTRSQELTFAGTYYYGYVVALPLAGHLADRFGGKMLYINSLALQGLAYIALPLMAYQSYAAAVFVLVVSGLFGACGTPPLYQLFVIWSHPLERTAMLSFAYSGLIVGSICIYPLANYLSDFGWSVSFYALGGVSLVYGILCNWLIYNSLDQHPRLSQAEREYLTPKEFAHKSQHVNIPWKCLLTSMPVYAFVLTHVFHNYGFLVLAQNLPRFMREAMRFDMQQIGYLSSATFLGSFLSKFMCVLSCSYVEKRMVLQLSCFRRVLYAITVIITIAALVSIILASCAQKPLVILMCVLLGLTTDLGFSAGYWPTLLYFAPSFAGLLSGLANSLGHISGFLAPYIVASLVDSGFKSEWNNVLLTIIGFYAVAMIVFGICSSMELQPWDPRSRSAAADNASAEQRR
ncbi:hypothetical protein KR222_002817 [Zaprionus bogoriensis]|nr:hypothetical protein KR222_002817 [Zaprionus bogoriensis]